MAAGITAMVACHATTPAAGGTPYSCSIVDYGAVSGESEGNALASLFRFSHVTPHPNTPIAIQ